MNPAQQLDPDQLPSELAERQAVARELKALTLAARARGELLTAMLHASDALMHWRMAQQQAAQRVVAEGSAGDPDPLVGPGQKVQKLSDYVRIMKRMQGGDFTAAIAEYGLDMMSYSSVATAWAQNSAADPSLNEKFSRMMARLKPNARAPRRLSNQRGLALLPVTSCRR